MEDQQTVRFDGRTIIVTGAGGGMGRAHAVLLASRGANVVVNDVANAHDVASSITASGGRAVASTSDISTLAGSQRVVNDAVAAFGGIHGLVNNAGISIHRPFARLTSDLLERTMAVNAFGALHMTWCAWPHLVESGSGRIVMIASTAAITGSPNLAHYAMSKGALLGLTRQLSAEGAGHGVTVNAVVPYAVTPMSSGMDDVAGAARGAVLSSIAGALGIEPSDHVALEQRTTDLVAPVVAWLCHPSCQISGEILKTKGGEVSRIAYVESAGIVDRELTIETLHERQAEILDLAAARLCAARRSSGSGQGDPIR